MEFFYRSCVEVNKLIPLIAEQPILKKYYGKQKRFTNAVDEIKRVIRNIEHEADEIRNKQKDADKSETQRLIRLVNQKVLKIVLSKLTFEEIEQHSNVKKPKPKSKLTPPPLSVVLRRRHH